MKKLFFILMLILLVITSCKDMQKAEIFHAEAHRAYLKKDLNNAEKKCRKSLSFNEDSLSSRLLLAKILYFKNKKNEAQKIISELINDYPCCSDALEIMAKIHISRYEFDKALNTVNSGLKCSASHPSLLYLKGKVLMYKNKKNASITAFSRGFSNYYYIRKSHADLSSFYNKVGLPKRKIKHENMIRAIHAFTD